MATRYAIVAFLFAFVLIFFVGGYYHAQRRLRRGQQPLAYHRWMTNRRHYDTSFQPRSAYSPNGTSHGMESYPPPPPAYNATEAPPPVYQPPQGATKALPDQSLPEANRFGQGSGGGLVAPGFSARR